MSEDLGDQIAVTTEVGEILEKTLNVSHRTVGLDYVDLRGGLRSLSLIVNDDMDAVDCVREAWNSNLLWHFKLYLDKREPLSMTREISWPLDILDRALALPNIDSHIERVQESVSYYEGKVLAHFISPDYDMKKDIQILAECAAEFSVVKTVKDKLIHELEGYGIQTSHLLEAERKRTLEYIVAAAKTLKNLQSGETDDFTVAISRSNWVSIKEFIKSLPEVPGIFGGGNKSGFFPAVEAAMEFTS